MNRLDWFPLRRVALALAVLVALASGCSLALQPKSAARTLIGTSRQQVLAAAQQVMIAEGYDIQSADAATGLLVTAWQEHSHRAERYEVAVQSTESADGEGGPLTLSVAGTARDRIVGGWSTEYPAGLESEDLLAAIAALVAERAAEQRPVRRAAPSRPACQRSSDCPDGKLCGSGRCVSECAADADCDEGRRCDYKGRCVVPPPEPEPCPAPPRAAADAGPLAAGEEVTR